MHAAREQYHLPSFSCRFVGLLLVTKLLSSGDLPVIKTVYNAIGSSFINRLLLPLGRRQVRHAQRHKRASPHDCQAHLPGPLLA